MRTFSSEKVRRVGMEGSASGQVEGGEGSSRKGREPTSGNLSPGGRLTRGEKGTIASAAEAAPERAASEH